MSERFELIFRHSPVAMALSRREDGTILDVNDACCRLLRRSRDQIVGRRSVGVGVWRDAAERAEIVARVLADGRLTGHEMRLVDGQRVRISIEPFCSDAGDACLLVVLEDVTSLREAEEALRESEARWKYALEGSDSGVWDWDATTDQVFFSDRWKSMLGYAPDEIGTGLEEWSSRVHPDDLDETLATVRAHLDGRTPEYVSEHRVRTKDGSYRWILDRGKVFTRTAEGRAQRVVGTHTDVTDIRRREEVRREQELVFRALFESAAIGTALVAPGGQFVKVNTALCDLLGYREAELLARTVEQVTHPDDLDADLALARELIAGQRRSYQLQKRYFHRDGHVIWVRLSVSAVRAADGGLQYFVGQIEDVTAARQAHEALEHMLAEKDVLLREVHHRVKNNLQVISSMLRLQQRGIEDPATRLALDDSQRRVQTMSLVHERLYQDHTASAVDMRRFLHDLVTQVYRSVAVEGAVVEQRMQVDDLVVPADVAIPCGLIVNELVSNAVRYAFAGRSRGVLIVVLQREGDELVLGVHDDGAGLPAEPRPGSLGLRLVDALARQLRGRFETSRAEGLRATVRFPYPIIGVTS